MAILEHVNFDIDILLCKCHTGDMHHLCRIPNIRQWLSVSMDMVPATATLWEGLLLLEGHIKGEVPDATGWICSECC